MKGIDEEGAGAQRHKGTSRSTSSRGVGGGCEAEVVDREPNGGTKWSRRNSLKYQAGVPPFAVQPEQRGNGRYAKHSAAAVQGATCLRSLRRPSSSRRGRRDRGVSEPHSRACCRVRGGTLAYVATGRTDGAGARAGGPSLKARFGAAMDHRPRVSSAPRRHDAGHW